MERCMSENYFEDNNLKYFQDIFTDSHGEWRKQWYASYYQGIKHLDQWYGDKAYREYEGWARVIDVVVQQTLAPYCCDLCGYMSETCKEGPKCPHCNMDTDWYKEINETDKFNPTSNTNME
jgi:hypothetical protein